MIDQSQLLQSVKASLSEDGQTSELQFLRKNGKTAHVQFSTANAAGVMLNIEMALGSLLESQKQMLKGRDPRAFFAMAPKHVTKLQGGMAQGLPVLSLVLETGLRLDFRLPAEQIRELIEWLETLEDQSRKPQTAPH